MVGTSEDAWKDLIHGGWVKSLSACLDSELEHGTGSRRAQKLGDALLGQRGIVGRISQLPRPGNEVVLEARHLRRRPDRLAQAVEQGSNSNSMGLRERSVESVGEV